MGKLNVLLVCGSGASSGFMAANMRKAAAEKKLELDIKARSESEIESYIDTTDVIMVGPHLDEIKEYANDNAKLKVILMKPEYYSRLDGEKAIQHLWENVN